MGPKEGECLLGLLVFIVIGVTSAQMDKSQSPLSKSGTPSPSHREALTPGAPGPSTSCLRLVSKAASGADPLGEEKQRDTKISLGFQASVFLGLAVVAFELSVFHPLFTSTPSSPPSSSSSLPSSPQSHVCAPRFVPGSFWRGVTRRAERRAGQPGRLRRRSDAVPANQRRGQRLLAQPHGEQRPDAPPLTHCSH